MIVCLIALSSPAQASCSTSSGSVDLGTVSSFAVAATTQNASGATGFTCTGSLLALASTNTITATISSATNSLGNQPRLFSAATGDYVPYSICKDAGCGTTYAVGSQIAWSSTTFAGILGLFNASGGSLPIYIRTTPGTQVTAGTYTSTINLGWNWHLCALGAFGICAYDNGTASSTVVVTMIVSKDCVINAPSLDFGSAAFVGSFDPVGRTIAIRCSKGTTYTVGIDNGVNYLGSRRLAQSGAYIGYEIYFPATSALRWGADGSERRGSADATGSAGLYTGTTDQTYSYKAQILLGQPTPPAGTYTDTLLVDVQF
jgi:spore coat protein U-like protein